MYTEYSEEEGCRGEIVDEIEPIEMVALMDKVICAKRGGASFIDSVRVD